MEVDPSRMDVDEADEMIDGVVVDALVKGTIVESDVDGKVPSEVLVFCRLV